MYCWISGCYSQFLQYTVVYSKNQEHVPNQVLPIWTGSELQAVRIVYNNDILTLVWSFVAIGHHYTWVWDHRWPGYKLWRTCQRQTNVLTINILVPACISCQIGKRSSAHAYNLRNSEDLKLPGCRTAATQSGFFYRAAKVWNSLCNNSRTARSLRSFKEHAKAELMKK